jgi:hypothetical protein
MSGLDHGFEPLTTYPEPRLRNLPTFIAPAASIALLFQK